MPLKIVQKHRHHFNQDVVYIKDGIHSNLSQPVNTKIVLPWLHVYNNNKRVCCHIQMSNDNIIETHFSSTMEFNNTYQRCQFIK